jgi:hypothetical protein
VLGALMVALTLGATTALAAHTKIGEIKEVNGHALVEPWGLAFDNSGNQFVSEGSRELVYKLNSSNAFVTEIGAGTLTFGTHHVAVDYATGTVYAGDDNLEKTFVFKPIVGGYELVQTISTEGYQLVAFDNSSGPNKGDLYIAGNRKVWKMATNGEGLVGAGGSEEEGEVIGTTLPAPEGFTNFEIVGEAGKGGIALNNANGKLYIAEPGRNRVTVYSPSGTYEAKIEGAATPGKSIKPFAVGVEDSTGDIYVYDQAHKVVDEFSSSGTYLEQFSEGITGEGTVGMAVSNAGANKHEIYVSDITVGATKINIYSATPSVKFKLTVEKTGTGSGTVTSNPAGISCGGTCSGEFEEGEKVILTESPSGSTFTGWTGCEAEPLPNECEVTMSAAKTVKAGFSLNPPVNTGLPKAEGTAKEGHTLTANPGTWEGSPSSFEYQWADCDALGANCSNIAGATGHEYTLISADAGHTVRVIVTAKNAGGSSSPAESPPTEVVGKLEAEASVSSNVYGEVEQAVTLGSEGCENVNLGPFVPSAVNHAYERTCTVTATTTLEKSTLTAEDSSATHTGHLVNGSYFLSEPLETKATETEGAATGGGTFQALTSPVTLLSYPAPWSFNAVTVAFQQKIPGHEGLRTGTYHKTITITLAATP